MGKCTIILVKDYAFLRLVQYKVDVNCQMQEFNSLSREEIFGENLSSHMYFSIHFLLGKLSCCQQTWKYQPNDVVYSALLMNAKKVENDMEYRQLSSGQLQIQLFAGPFWMGIHESNIHFFSYLLCTNCHAIIIMKNYDIQMFWNWTSLLEPSHVAFLYPLFLLLNSTTFFYISRVLRKPSAFPIKMWKYKYFPF